MPNPIDMLHDATETEVGSYFVANYPPFSVWAAEHLPRVESALNSPPVESPAPPLGLYLHIPFCRKRCKFCYFRVYTDKNARDVDAYVDALAREVALYANRAVLADRAFDFVYFGGGTPSYLSSDQLKRLIARISEHWSWESAREVTFECEPGTLKKSKLRTIKEIGVTRLSLGIEHFDDDILELNGRAHKSPEIFRAFEWAREVGFAQINVDLIAGMVGDTDSKWEETVSKAMELKPDSVTIYQMELPHNTVVARESKSTGQPAPVANWSTKRAWVDHAFRRFESAGYKVSSAYTLVKPSDHSGFVYRDAVWRGADMVGTGVASFSHLSGVHYQNVDGWDDYVRVLGGGALPLGRALPTTVRDRWTREMILQLKLGHLDAAYFQKKFDVNISEQHADAWTSLVDRGLASLHADRVLLTRAGLLRVDSLLPMFFEPEFQNLRYT